jgi:hypothetical protein
MAILLQLWDGQQMLMELILLLWVKEQKLIDQYLQRWDIEQLLIDMLLQRWEILPPPVELIHLPHEKMLKHYITIPLSEMMDQ